MTIEFTLEKPLTLANHLQNPQNDISNYVHIAGSNGKTSTAILLSRLLHSNSKLRIGTFIHPPIGHPRECILLNEEPIEYNVFGELWRHVNKMDEIFSTRCTPYERLFLVALLVFREWRCEVVVVEAALGGTFDATNVLAHSPARQLAAVITNISPDHTKFLGPTVEQIAANMLGIVRETAPVIISVNQMDSVKQFLSSRNLNVTPSVEIFGSLDHRSFILPLPDHQMGENVDLALRTFQVIAPQLEHYNGGPLHKPTFGVFASTLLPQSFKRLYYRGTEIISDAAQNAGSLFCNWLARRSPKEGRVHIVLGLSDKDGETIGMFLRSLGINCNNRYSFVKFHPPEGYPWIHPADHTHLRHLLTSVYSESGVEPPRITNHTELSEVLTDIDGDGLVVILGSPHIVKDFYRLCGESH